MTWPRIPLGELSVERGGSVDPSKYPNEIFELFSIPAFDKGEAEIIAGKEIGSSKKCVQPNDVLISRIVPHIRRSWVVPEINGYRQIASGEWIQFRSDQIYPNFLRHFLVSDPFYQKFMKTVSGVGGSLLRARPKEVYRIKVPLPPLEEQKRIARILDTADEIRAKRRQSIEELDRLAQSVFLDMFGDPVKNPKGWPRINLAKIASINGKLVNPTKAEYQNLLHFGPDRISKDTGVLLDAKTAREDQLISSKFLCYPGEILYSKIRPYLNKVALVQEKCLCSADVYPIKPLPKYLTIEFLWVLLRSNDFLNYVASFSRRANIPKINRKQLFGYSAPVPPLENQKKYSSIIQSIESQKSLLQQHLTELDNLFASLQSRAFNGSL